MKKLSLVVLLGLVISGVFTGCNKADETPKPATPPATNAPAAP